MRFNSFTIFTILIVSALSVTACGAGGDPFILAGTTWKLVSYGSASTPTAAMSGVKTNLTFDEHRRLQGNMGCNSFGGDYKLSGNQMIFGAIISTMMACQDPVMQQEQAVLKVLNGSAKFETSSGRLTITSKDGSITLVFIQAGK